MTSREKCYEKDWLLKLLALAAISSVQLSMTGGLHHRVRSRERPSDTTWTTPMTSTRRASRCSRRLAEREGWTVLDIVGQGTAPDPDRRRRELHHPGRRRAARRPELARDRRRKTLKLAAAAGIPEFHLTHNPPNEPGLGGFAGYDWVTIGELRRQVGDAA